MSGEAKVEDQVNGVGGFIGLPTLTSNRCKGQFSASSRKRRSDGTQSLREYLARRREWSWRGIGDGRDRTVRTVR